MNEFPKFCDFHKRWFNGRSCDYCERDTLIAKAKGHDAAWYARMLAPHADCGHLLTTEMLLPDGRSITVGDMQDLIWSLEHYEWADA